MKSTILVGIIGAILVLVSCVQKKEKTSNSNKEERPTGVYNLGVKNSQAKKSNTEVYNYLHM